MRRSLILRRDILTELTPGDLAAVVGAQDDSIPCTSRAGCEVVAVLRNWLEDQTVLCPMSQGCPPAP